MMKNLEEMIMVKILINCKLQNFLDIATGQEKIRSIEIKNALVDTGVSLLNIHKNQIDELGLKYLRKVKAKTANGQVERNVYGIARVEIEGREAEFEILEIPDDVPILVGYLVLERLDFVVDTSNQRLIPNPMHDGEFAIDLY
jgi:predicted aspartyl protease